ncbi:MAG TPA: methyltransferase domain-containing protein [Candidatus Paceibacterota bacterium]|nr:methyltransferase domain-containing protein [Candidatus Paceibacterota bacterium]
MNFADPKSNVLQLGLREGMKVADLGAGSGHYSIAAAGAVGMDGRVYAVDIQEDLLKHLVDSAHQMGLRNVEMVWGDIERKGGTKLRDQSMDAVILSNVLFQLAEPKEVIAEILRILKPGGKLLVVDWAGAYGGMGPHPEQVVSEHAAEELFITGGFHKLKDFRAGAHHYAIVFTSPDR